MNLRIAHLASEAVPFSKTGGLADVVGALPPALAALGNAVTVVVPAHRATVKEELPGKSVGEVWAMGMRAELRETHHNGTTVVLLDCPQLFVRPALYSLPEGDFPDNPIRYAFFARAALYAVAARGGADVIHAHDWQSALAPLLLARFPEHRAGLPAAVSVLTIHNLAYQGVFPPWVLEACQLPRELFTLDTLEFYGQVNFLKGGLVSADAITTVSPTYAREILTPQFGCRLEGVLATRSDRLVGILNGLDLETWNPATDRYIPAPYTAATMREGKKAAREALAAEAELAPGARPLIGMVSRLAEQKGADLLAAALEDIVALGFDVVVLGTGERRYEETLQAAQLSHPGRVRVFARFDEGLAHRIYAGSDLFLMPSRWEPCGLGQMIAMRYGTLPVVTRTGGLADTVAEVGEPSGTGFVLAELSPQALVAALTRARELLQNPSRRDAVRREGMSRDFSWDRSARAYEELYRSLLA